MLELATNLGVSRAPVLRVADGAQGITLHGEDNGDGFDCGPPVPLPEPANPGEVALTLGSSGLASAHSFTSAPLSAPPSRARRSTPP